MSRSHDLLTYRPELLPAPVIPSHRQMIFPDPPIAIIAQERLVHLVGAGGRLTILERENHHALKAVSCRLVSRQFPGAVFGAMQAAGYRRGFLDRKGDIRIALMECVSAEDLTPP